MNELIGLLAALIFGILTLPAFFLAVGALFPNRVERTRLMADGSPGRAFGVGLVNLAFLFTIAATFFTLADNASLGFLSLPGIIVLSLLIIGVIFGLTGLVQLVGERLAPAQSPTARGFWGALALSLGCAVPIVGWFALLPYAVIVGLGAFVLSFLYAPRKPEPATAA